MMGTDSTWSMARIRERFMILYIESTEDENQQSLVDCAMHKQLPVVCPCDAKYMPGIGTVFSLHKGGS